MKKITLSILMSIAFVSLTNAQVDKLLPPGTDINLNPQVSDITKLKKDFLLKLKLNEKNLNFNQPVLPKTSQLEAPSFPKSIPETREFSKNSKKDIPSVAERKKRFHNKRRNRSTEISKSNSNVSNYKILNNSTDALTNLYPYDLIYRNDLIKIEEVAVIGSYIDKYTYYEDGTIEQELYYNYDSAAGTYLLIESVYYSNLYDSNGNLIERAFYDYNLVTGSFEGQSFQVFDYFDNFIDEVYTYDWDGNGQTRNSIFVDTTGTYIENIINYNINSTGDAWEYYDLQTFLYNDSMLLQEAQNDIWSQDDGDFSIPNDVNYYVYNTDNSLILEVYYTYDSEGNLTPTWREDFFYHEGYFQEKILYQRLQLDDWDGSTWANDYLTSLPDLSRGYGEIFVEGKEYDWNPAGVWVAQDDTYFIYSYTPPATITPNYTETFDTFPPQAWEFARGDYGSPTGVLTKFGEANFGNDSDSPNGNSAVINIFGNLVADYFASPVFDLSGGTYFLNYDVALTEWATTNPSTLGADDYVAVLVTQDRGVSWTELYRWDANTEISNDGQSATEISMTGYGAEVQFAFYANSGDNDDEDNDFFIDNFQITSETLSTSTNTLEGFTIYPTIVKEELNFRSQNKVEAVTVFNLLGQKVFFGAPNTNNSSINLSKLRPGIYVVKVSSEGKIGSYKIIKE